MYYLHSNRLSLFLLIGNGVILQEFGKFFKSWIGLYCDNIGDSVNLKLRPKVISAISALLSDIEALNKSFIVGLDPRWVEIKIEEWDFCLYRFNLIYWVLSNCSI